MVLNNPVADVPFNITRLSHVVLTSRDLDATRYFYESGLGLEVTEHSDEHLCLRAIEEVAHHSLRFDKVDRDGPGQVRAIGYRMFSDDDCRAFDWLSARGDNPVGRAPVQGLTLRVVDAVGVPVEFTATMAGPETACATSTHAAESWCFSTTCRLRPTTYKRPTTGISTLASG